MSRAHKIGLVYNIFSHGPIHYRMCMRIGRFRKRLWGLLPPFQFKKIKNVIKHSEKGRRENDRNTT